MNQDHLKLPFELTSQQTEIINKRLLEFKELGKKRNEKWFSELCFCILTANSQAQKAIDIQNYLGVKGFLCCSEQDLAKTIRSFGHRFHNNKAKYIVLARKYCNVKDLLADLTDAEARDFLVKNIKGLGYKEASHFLRNVGYDNVAIIDRHILKFLYQDKIIEAIPNSLSPKLYLEIENTLRHYNIPLSRLDLMIWCYVTGKILK